jgi:hypothetical protein
MSSKSDRKPNTSHELVIFNIGHLIENASKADERIAPNQIQRENIPGDYVALLKVTDKETKIWKKSGVRIF